MTEPVSFFIDRAATPLGEIVVVCDAEGRLCAVDWSDYQERMTTLLNRYFGVGSFTLIPRQDPHGITTALQRYFSGDFLAIQDLAVRPAGTAFQQAVWNALRQIPCGSVASYGEIARTIGRPNAVRAVGLANGSNPVGIVVPCHRVIGSNGALTGYGGGLHRKQWLLAHEGSRPDL